MKWRCTIMRSLVRLWVWLLLLGVSSPAVANGPEIGRDAGIIFPIRSEGIRLIREKVDIRLPGSEVDRGRAECLYELRNVTNTKRTIKMAFVYTRPQMYNSREFMVYISASPVQHLPVHFEPIDKEQFREFMRNPPDSLPVWELTIPAQEQVTVGIAYDISWSTGGSRYLFRYHARPATLWEGNVEEAEIRIWFPGLFGWLIRCGAVDNCLSWAIEPEGYEWTERGIEWHLTDWEPSQDFVLRVDLLGLDEEQSN